MGNDNRQNADKNKMGVIIGLGVALIVGAIVLCIALVSVFSDSAKDKERTTRYALTSNAGVSLSETSDNSVGGLDNNSVNNNANVNDNNGNAAHNNQQAGMNGAGSEKTTSVKTTKNEAVEYYEQLSKNGENVLSDYYDNEFIKLISDTYGVDSDLLVAIYSEPDTGNNFVLQFNGTKDSNGRFIKSPDTLKFVYQIDKERNIKIATGTKSGNVGVSYAEGMLCFNMVKTLVMEQYPDYFTGLKK